MLQIYPYQCECGWNTEYITACVHRPISLAERVENQLIRAKNLNARTVWRDLYQNVITEKIVPNNVKVREGIVSCVYCKSSHNQFALFDPNNQLFHSILCNECGREGHFFYPPEPILCPLCSSIIATGEIFSSEEQILRLLNQCQVTIPEETATPVIMVMGERSNKYLRPYLSEIPHISIQEGEISTASVDVINQLKNSKRIFLHTYFETPIATRLTLLIAKQLFSMNIDVIPIIGTPPSFDGKRRIERVMGHIQELQSYCVTSELVSTSIRIKFDQVMELFEQHVPSQVIDIINRYSLEEAVKSSQ